MFDKKSALKCMIIFYSLSLVFVIAFLIDTFVVKFTADETKQLLFPTLSIVFFLSAVVMTAIYIRMRKRNVSNAASNTYKRPEIDEESFKQWLTKFEPYTKLSAQLSKISQKTFTKFGGLPIVPTEFSWPLYNNCPIPFLFQADFAEINADKALKNFPTDGLMYVFVDSDCVNFADVEGYTYTEGKTYKVLFFYKTDSLQTALKPDLLKTVYKEFYVSAKTVKTYPDVEDCDEAFSIYCDRPVGGMDDAYDSMQWKNMENFMIGGWASYIQSGGYIIGLKENEQDKWTLLMQIGSADSDSGFMWGDCGVLYFYIREEDLKARNFNNVKMAMQCT